MKKNLISEISRISELMGAKQLVTEQAAVKFMKSLYSMSDDVIKNFMKSFDSEVDNAINIVKKADGTVADNVVDDAIDVLLRNIDFAKLANIIIDQKMLGSSFDSQINNVIEVIKKNPNKKAEILSKVDNAIDELSFLTDAPDELVKQIKSQTRSKIDNALPKASSATNILSDELDKLLRESLNNNVDDVLNGTKSIDDVLKEFLTINGKKLSDFYNPKELSDYLTQLKGTLAQTSTKLTSSFGADIEKVWGQMTLSQQREFAKKSIEEITKKIPFAYRDLFDVKKLTSYMLKGADNEFSIKLFLSRLINIWKMSIGIQIVGLLWKGTNITAQQREGYELTWEDKLNYIMDGRSMQEMGFDILVPFVSWAATLIAAFDKDTTFDELKSQLPLTIRDNIYRNDSGEGYYVKQAGVTYPLELHNNQWEIQIDGQWYKLSDVDF